MKCYYQMPKGEEWIKGYLESLHGGTMVNFHSRTEAGVVENQLTFTNTETHFYGSGFSITGYLRVGELYECVTVKVQTTKPKVKK